MKVEEVKQLKQRLKAEYDADSAAIDRVLKLLEAEGGAVKTFHEPSTGTLDQKVSAAIATLPNQFALADVMGKLAETYPNEEINRASVSSVIYRLKEDNKISLIRAGIGRRAAIYGKP